METNKPKLTMTADEIFQLHPLPWAHHLLLIKDANDRQVIHTGGLYDDRSRLHQGEYLSGLNALLVEFANSRNNTSGSARRAADEIDTLLVPLRDYDKTPRVSTMAAIISKHFATPASGERWRQGMKDAAKEVCDACSNEERYGPARKIEGSTRWWHGEHADFQCEAGDIWHALAERADSPLAAAPTDNDAHEVCRLLTTLDWVVGYELVTENQLILDRAQELALKVMGMSDPPTTTKGVR